MVYYHVVSQYQYFRLYCKNGKSQDTSLQGSCTMLCSKISSCRSVSLTLSYTSPERRKIVYPKSARRTRPSRPPERHQSRSDHNQIFAVKTPLTMASMRAIRKSSSHQAYTPNLLPCRIQHNGPVDISPRYWSPVSAGTSPLLPAISEAADEH